MCSSRVSSDPLHEHAADEAARDQEHPDQQERDWIPTYPEQPAAGPARQLVGRILKPLSLLVDDLLL